MFVGTVDQGSRGRRRCHTEPRDVVVPGDLLDALSHSHRKHWVRWVQEAKRAETRGARINRAVEHPPGREPGDLGHKRTV